MLVCRRVHENVCYLECINVFPLASAHTRIHIEGMPVRVYTGWKVSSLPPSLSHAHSALHPSHLRNRVQNYIGAFSTEQN